MENVITLNVDYQHIATLVAEKIANEPAKEPEKPLIIRGIRGLAAYLEISTSTAQKLKNLKIVPYWTIGNRVYFDSVAVEQAVRSHE